MERPSKSREFGKLRRKAEDKLRRLGADTGHEAEGEDVAALLHELSVHQVELEMQNDELRHARSKTEEALERYAELYDFAPVGYFTLNDLGVILGANLTGARLLGVNRADLVNQALMLHLAQASRGVFLRFLNDAFETGSPQYCEVDLRPESSPSACLRIEGVVRDDPSHKRPQCWAAAIDISQTRRAEQSLRNAHDELEQRVVDRTAELFAANETLRWAREQAEMREAELKSFIASALDGLILVNAEGRIVFANDASVEMLGAVAGELIADRIERIRLYTTDEQPLPAQALPTCRALDGEMVKGETHKIVLPSGRELVVSTSAAPIQDTEGAILGAASVFHDVTEKAHWEKHKNEIYQREHNIAEALQNALVPPEIKRELPGIEIAIQYRAASDEARVGGDFYDIIELDDGRVGVLIGDVVGKGLPAAIRVAAVRYAIRSYAYIDPSPGMVMTRANEALCRDTDEDGCGGARMLTGLFLVVDPSQRTVMHANGGHESPFLVRPDGTVREVKIQGQILGAAGGYCFPEATLRIEPDDVIVMLTDGITEARSDTRMFGVDGVVDCLSRRAGQSPDELARAVLEEAVNYSGGRLRDDAAILALQLK